MRALIFIFIIATLPFTSATAAKVKPKTNGKLLLSVKTKYPYSDELSKFYEDKNKIICVTELSPRAIIPKKADMIEVQSLAKAFFDAHVKDKKPSCQNVVMVALPDKKTASDCADTPESRQLLNKVGALCGRN